jgi:nicotinamidase/pyrazinamidase
MTAPLFASAVRSAGRTRSPLLTTHTPLVNVFDMTLRLKESVLLVIDVQNDFCPGGRLEVKRGDEVIPAINSLMPLFPRVVATQDWHPRGHVSFASSHRGKEVYDAVEVGGIRQVLWPDHCVQGSEGADFHPALERRFFSLILRKGFTPGLDSYSAFFENDRKTPTGLAFFLKGLGVEQVCLCGLATDYCVLYSAADAVALGFGVFLVEDAARGVDVPAGSESRALETMRSGGVTILRSRELIPL